MSHKGREKPSEPLRETLYQVVTLVGFEEREPLWGYVVPGINCTLVWAFARFLARWLLFFSLAFAIFSMLLRLFPVATYA